MTILDPDSQVFSFHHNFKEKRLDVVFKQDIDLLHSCHETNTFVLTEKWDLTREFRNDWFSPFHDIDNSPVAFGQFAFLSYQSDGRFILFCESDRYKPGVVEQAFQSFGYAEAKMRVIGGDSYIQVGPKDTFRLKLKYGT